MHPKVVCSVVFDPPRSGDLLYLPQVGYSRRRNERPICWEPRAQRFFLKREAGPHIALHATSTASVILQTQTLKTFKLRTQSSKVLFKPGAGQYIALHATSIALDFFLPNFTLLVHSPAFFSKTSLEFFSVLAAANTGSCVGPQNTIDHPANHYRQLMQVPMLCASGIETGSKTCVIVFSGFTSEIVDII